MRIAVDAMGGDLAPGAPVEGAMLAVRDFGIEVVLVGDRAIVEREMASRDATNLPLTIAHASERIEMSEPPVEAVLEKPDSSLHVGYEMLKRGEVDAFLSAGNSGATAMAAMVILGNLAGVDRPAMALLVPSGRDHALLIDGGINVEVKPYNLVEFAAMGTVYMRWVRKITRPRVGILANGCEDSKGTDLTRAAAATLRAMARDINYIGHIEGSDINSGKIDVAVTDGFTGNIALKTMEGFAPFRIGELRDFIGAGFRGKLAYLLLRKQVRLLRRRFDTSELGGAPLLGVNGVAMIAHGSSNARTIRNAIRTSANEALLRHVNAEIIELLRKVPPEERPATRPASERIRALFDMIRGQQHHHRGDQSQESAAS